MLKNSYWAMLRSDGYLVRGRVLVIGGSSGRSFIERAGSVGVDTAAQDLWAVWGRAACGADGCCAPQTVTWRTRPGSHTSQELETRSEDLWPNRGFFIAGLMIVFMAIMNLQNTLASLAGVF